MSHNNRSILGTLQRDGRFGSHPDEQSSQIDWFCTGFHWFPQIFIGWPSSGGPGLIIIRERGCQNQGIIMEILLRRSFVSLCFLIVSLDIHLFSSAIHMRSLGFC